VTAEREKARAMRRKRLQRQIELLRQQLQKTGNDLEYESLLQRVRDNERLLRKRDCN